MADDGRARESKERTGLPSGAQSVAAVVSHPEVVVSSVIRQLCARARPR